jgi:hypothetical protein
MKTVMISHINCNENAHISFLLLIHQAPKKLTISYLLTVASVLDND